jgi:lipopolysaccharide export system permease protein
MKLIDRFVSRELIVNVLFASLVLSLVLVVGNILRKLLPLLVNHDVPLEYLLTFIAYVLPFSLIFTIPWGLLTAILLVFGRLSADNELIALGSNGVSVTSVCLPLLVLAIISTAICLWLNVDVAPAAQEKLRSTIFDLATRNPIAQPRLVSERGRHLPARLERQHFRSQCWPQPACRIAWFFPRVLTGTRFERFT